MKYREIFDLHDRIRCIRNNPSTFSKKWIKKWMKSFEYNGAAMLPIAMLRIRDMALAAALRP